MAHLLFPIQRFLRVRDRQGQPFLKFFLGRHLGQILCDADIAFVQAHKFDCLFGFVCAEDKRDRLVFTRPHLVLLKIAEIEFDLVFAGRFEFSDYQVDHDETVEPAVVEEQVDVVVVAVEDEVLLPGEKDEIAPISRMSFCSSARIAFSKPFSL